MRCALIVIGASLGGLRALQTVLPALPAGFALPLVVVQHRLPDAGDSLQFVLQESCALPVREVIDKMPIEAGTVYLAPSGYHLLVEGDHFVLSTEDPVFLARPSIDALFESAAQAHGAQVVGVVLTGTGSDGAASALAIASAGGRVIVQDPRSAQEAQMPQCSLDAVSDALLLDITQIGPYIAQLGGAAPQPGPEQS